MRLTDLDRLKNHITSLDEKGVWALVAEFFDFLGHEAKILHSPGEHGMDVVAFIDKTKDILGKGYFILIQAKTGKLGLDRWRKEVLYQLLEMPYYEIPHPDYDIYRARRVLLAVTDSATDEVHDSIKVFNKKHEVIVELWELDDIIRRFQSTGFAQLILEKITGVGQVTEPVVMPPAVGEEPN